MRISVNNLFLNVEPETKIVTLSRQSTNFTFMDMNNNLTLTIEPLLRYVFTCIIDDTLYVMHMHENGTLQMVNERVTNTLKRVYYSSPIVENGLTAVSRFIFTEDNQLVWPGSNDIVILENVELNINCVRDCANKKCNESDGCGSVCGCGVGNTCLPDGSCQVQQPNSQASLCSNTGTCTGRCFGTCSTGSICSQDNGVFSCKIGGAINTYIWIIVAVLIFLGIILFALREI